MNNKSIHHKLYESRRLWIAASAFILSCNATTMIINADDVGYTQLNDTTAQTVSDYSPDADKVDQQIGVDDSQLQNAVSTAEKAGVVIVEEPTQTISIDANNAESIRQAKIESEGDYLQQISNIQNAQQKQLEKEKQYTEQFDEYNLALHKGKKQNADGKTQFVTSAAKQALKFDNSKPADESDPISDINPSNIFTGIGSHANLNDSTKVWEYEGNDLLHANIEKTWAKAGSIEDEYGHKQYVDFHETFHDFQLQNGNWNESTNSFEDNGSPHVAISSNAIDNIWTTNLNWQTTFWFTYSDTCEMVPISNQIASDSVPKVYFLSGSLSSTNYSMEKVTGNRREYVQTNDAKTAIINENSAITLDNIDCEGVVNNAPDGLAYTNTSPDFQSVEGDEDTNPQHYAIEEGVSFTDFTTDKPTLYFGAVPMNRKAWWWRQNHNMNSDELAFLKKPEKIDPETVSYHLNRIMYQQNNKLDPALTYSSDLSDGQNKAPKNFTKISATEPTADAVLSKKAEITVHYVLKKIHGVELRPTQTIAGIDGQMYYDESGNLISYDDNGELKTYEIPETIDQEVAGIEDSTDKLLHYTYTADGNGGLFNKTNKNNNSKQNVWIIYTYTVDGKNGINGLDGKDGADGKPGRDGIDGHDGKNGTDGKPGQDGRNGLDGVDGKNGSDGKPGRDGVNGQDGLAGKNGTDGKPGQDGRNGLDGIDGKNGSDGKPGRDGVNGQDGHDGKNGIDGKAGRDGVNGQDGHDGKNGIDGKAGRDGANGEDGLAGKNGTDGKPGQDGRNGLDGIAGKNGSDGKPGRDGVNGQDGYDGKNGIDGKAGRDGANGEDGLAGKDGADGKPGQDGVNGQDGHDGKNGIDGKTGRDGANGEDGLAGKNGTDGKPGQNGRNGLDGIAGKNGSDGKPGQDGRNGLDGIAGKNGSDGKPGRDGANGEDGRNGLDGLAGKNGTDGKPGQDGRNGLDGVDGKNGSDGKPGRDGVNGQDGHDGKNGIDGKAGRDGANGEDGLAGKNGADGKPGRDGVNGQDGHAGKNGIDGKAGRDGANGEDGVAGKDGIDGKPGQDGVNGQDGHAGKDGIDGKPGLDGVNGEDGLAGKNKVDDNENYYNNQVSFMDENNYADCLIVDNHSFEYVQEYPLAATTNNITENKSVVLSKYDEIKTDDPLKLNNLAADSDENISKQEQVDKTNIFPNNYLSYQPALNENGLQNMDQPDILFDKNKFSKNSEQMNATLTMLPKTGRSAFSLIENMLNFLILVILFALFNLFKNKLKNIKI